MLIVESMFSSPINIYQQGYYRGMFAPKYVWITPSWYSKGWWKEDYGNSSCTPDIMRKMLNNSLAITPSGYFVSDELSTATFSGLVGFNYSYDCTIMNLYFYHHTTDSTGL